MPPDATEIRFESNVRPLFGEYFLVLRFRTTIDDLGAFLDRSGLPDPGGNPADPIDHWSSSCVLDPLPAGRPIYSQDPPERPDSYQRVIAVDAHQSANVLVLVKAEDDP